MCHGRDGYAAGDAPDLRASAVISSDAAFEAVVADGTLVAHGMPRFDDMSKQTREDIRQYLRSLADAARQAAAAGRPDGARRVGAEQSGG
jgi:quinohemoprotein ethanol dehydrogenase